MTSASRFILGSVIFSRGIYSLSWFVMAASFPALSLGYGYNLQTLGLFTTAFLVAAGAFQLPAGIYAARHSAHKAALYGLVTLAVTNAASAYTGEFYFQLVLRFLSGVGAAFYFAPGLVIAATALRSRSGLATGLYSAVFAAGGALAAFSFTPLASAFGWRFPFLIVSALTLVAFLQNLYAFRRYPAPRPTTVASPHAVLRSKTIWYVAIGVLGVSAVNYVITQFLITYTESHLGYSAALAGSVSSLVFVGSFVGGPLGGLLSDHLKTRRTLIVLPTVGTALSVALFSLNTEGALVAGAFLAGFFLSAGYSNAYAYPTQLGLDRSITPFAVGLTNSVGILYGSVITALFTTIVNGVGFSLGWIVLTFISLATTPLIFLAREPPPAGDSKPAS